MNIGELKKLIKHLPNDMEILQKNKDYKLGKSLIEADSIKIVKVRKEKQFFVNESGSLYAKEVYIFDENGTETLMI